MSHEKSHLAELFGLVRHDGEDDSAERKPVKVGKSAEESRKLGEKSMNDGEFAIAAEHFQRAIDQGDISARVDLASAHEAMGDDETAAIEYTRALELDRDLAEARLGMSEIFKRQSGFRQAVEQLYDAIAKEPNNPNYYFKLSETLREMKLMTEAIQAAERAALSQPDTAFYHQWLADLLIEKKLYSDALDPLKTALDLSPGDDYLYFQTAIAFYGAGKLDEAKKAIQLAVELAPDSGLYAGFKEFLAEKSGAETEVRAKLDPYDLDRLNRVMKSLGEPPRANLDQDS